MQNLKPVLNPDYLYLGDNGECFCGKHAGQSAKYTGRDTSGQKVYRVTEADQQSMVRDFGMRLECESCEIQ